MTKANSKRQAEFRKRIKERKEALANNTSTDFVSDVHKDRSRINLVISARSKRCLDAMAEKHGVKKTEMLEAMISDYSDREMAGLSIEGLLKYLKLDNS